MNIPSLTVRRQQSFQAVRTCGKEWDEPGEEKASTES